MYVAYVLALAERWDLQPKYYEAEIEIALRAIKNALTDLAEEAVAREYLAEGFAIVDALFRGVRVTWVAALLCILGLWRKADGDEQTGLDRSIRRFVAENHQDIAPWGESAVPHLLAVYWHDRFVNAMSRRADESLKSLVRFMCEAKKLDGRMVLPDVYVEAKDWLPYVADQQLEKLLPEQFGFRLAKEPLTVNYQGYSHTLEGLVHLLVQQNWKQEVKALWSSVTKINLHTLEFEEPWHFYRWRNEEGTERVVMPQHTRRWEELKTKAGDSSGEGLPNLLRQRPIFALLFVCVYPHRTNAALLQWLNRGLKETIYRA